MSISFVWRKTHFDFEYFGGNGLVVIPEISDNSALIKIDTYVNNIKKGDEIFFRIFDARRNEVSQCRKEITSAVLTIENVHLWHGRIDPYLYTAEVAIVRGGEDIDKILSRFGCRTFRIDPENGFILNGKEYPLHGVSRHQDRWQIGNALLPEHHLEDMDLLCEVGANTIRLAHYQHDRYFYDLCDERGMVVWAEIPYISRHMSGGNENTLSQMRELIVQNYNHPSICVWGFSSLWQKNEWRQVKILRQRQKEEKEKIQESGNEQRCYEYDREIYRSSLYRYAWYEECFLYKGRAV